MAAVTREHRADSFWWRLNEGERSVIAEVARVRPYPKGATLIRFARRDQWVAILLSGRVRVLGVDGARTIAMRSAGDIIGEQALIERRARSATVLTETAVRALVLGGKELDRLLDRYPRILRVLCAVLSERLREAGESLSDQQDDAVTKVLQRLVRLADESGFVMGRGIRVHIGSQAALGEQLAVSRESVVRALGKLRRKRIVTTHRGMVTIHNLPALHELAVGNKSTR